MAEDYVIVYLNGATPHRRTPGLGWLKRCYQMIDRRLRKNLKSFIILHPSWFIRTVLAITKPFIRCAQPRRRWKAFCSHGFFFFGVKNHLVQDADSPRTFALMIFPPDSSRVCGTRGLTECVKVILIRHVRLQLAGVGG